MIRHLKHHEINKEQWDNCIANSANAFVYAYSWYLDIVCPAWEALIENNYQSVMPLPVKKKLGISYLIRPCFTQQLGIFSKSHISDNQIKGFIQAIPSDFKYINITFNYLNSFASIDMNTKEHKNYELHLNKTYNELSSKFKGNQIRNHKKAINNKLVVKKDLSIDELIAFKKANNEIFISKKELTLLQNILNKAFQKNALKIYSIFTADNILLAAASFIIFNNRIIYLFSVSSNKGKKMSAMFMMLDCIIKDYSNTVMILDFEGSNILPIESFFLGFGPKLVPYNSLIINNLPWYLKFFKK